MRRRGRGRRRTRASCGRLSERAVDVHAVSGAGSGAIAAALFAMGLSRDEMQNAARRAAKEKRRLLDYPLPGSGRTDGMLQGRGISRFLLSITKGAAMSDCVRPLAVPCLAALSGKTLAFTSLPGMRSRSVVFTREAPLWFAVRAAMSTPGLIAHVEWMEVPLVAVQEASGCVQALLSMGAQEILLVSPRYQAPRTCDAFTLSALCKAHCFERPAEERVHVIAPELPQGIGALSPGRFGRMRTGRICGCGTGAGRAARKLGYAGARVLPFRRRDCQPTGLHGLGYGRRART